MSKSTSAQLFRDSLPVAGRDGTLAGRLRTATGRINAKTGTLTHISSLSGYVMTADNETLVFSIICNNETSDDSSNGTIDSIATLLASFHQQTP
jgi:D-alanyl-D-alanine carboxypeptidase/D-alanyl-D-alanine-endopeptidase (penicillin-binding protein 4)